MGVMQEAGLKFERGVAIDGNMKRRLLEQDEEDDKFDDYGGK